MKLLPVFILLALCITCTTIVGALEPDVISPIPPNSSETPFDIDTYQIPELKFDSTQQPIIITDELKPTQQPKSSARCLGIPTEPSELPYGSIVYHSSNNGILTTTAFDSKGAQIFTTTDNTAALITTPQGEKPATAVHEIPSGSVVYERNGNTYVTYNNSVILALIYNQTTTNTANTTSRIDTGSAPTTSGGTWNFLDNYVGWITYTEDAANELGYFSGEWNAPETTPENSKIGEAFAAFIGIETNGATESPGIMQPVLAWNYHKNHELNANHEYSAAAWDFHDIPTDTINYDEVLHGTPFHVSPGEKVYGAMERERDGKWSISITDSNRFKFSQFTTSRYPASNKKWMIYVVTEAVGAGLKNRADALPGTITFEHLFVGKHETTKDGTRYIVKLPLKTPFQARIDPLVPKPPSRFLVDTATECNNEGCTTDAANKVIVYFNR